jgi:hypothetical protein
MRFSLQFHVTDAMFPHVNHGSVSGQTGKVGTILQRNSMIIKVSWLNAGAYMEQLVWCFLAVKAHGKPSLVVLVLAIIIAALVATNGCPTVSTSSHLHGLIG